MTSPESPPDPLFAERVRASFDKQRFMTTLGATLGEVAPGRVRIDMGHEEAMTQQHGFVHAAAISAIADSAAGYAALTLMPAGTGVLTVEYKVNLLAPARGDRYHAVGVVKKAGRTLTYATADAFAHVEGKEKLVASLVATIMTLRDRGLVD